MNRSILVVEDDQDIARLLVVNLHDVCRHVAVARDVRDALQQLRAQSFSLVILDLMLPDGDGLEVCRFLRGHADYTPILMLTARSTEADRVDGLESGADDYLVKPFSIRELLARVKALFRRVAALDGSGDAPPPPRVCGDLVIDFAQRTVRLRGQALELTAKEFDLLAHFATHPGRVYTRTQLLDSVWGVGYDGYEHTVNSHINRLRAKIEDAPAAPRFILTVWGVGYKFAAGDGAPE
jgi:DNA-binding response OmpR family regulator